MVDALGSRDNPLLGFVSLAVAFVNLLDPWCWLEAK